MAEDKRRRKNLYNVFNSREESLAGDYVENIVYRVRLFPVG